MYVAGMLPGEAASVASVGYFYGRISRDEAEGVLRRSGCTEGLYLLRENVTVAGNYALSICHQNRIHHYSIERQSDGTVMIQDGRRFSGPVELINHHKQTLDGFLTKPRVPCNRPDGVAPMAWPGVTMFELEQAILERAFSRGAQGGSSSGLSRDEVLGAQRQKFIAMVARDLHKDQSWFHGAIEREAADQIMSESGHHDGKFLLREKANGTYALSISYRGVTKHYKIDRRKSAATGDRFAIEDGPQFENLMDMIAHYHNKTDGLLCKLTCPCERKNSRRKVKATTSCDTACTGCAHSSVPFAAHPVSEHRQNSRHSASEAAASSRPSSASCSEAARGASDGAFASREAHRPDSIRVTDRNSDLPPVGRVVSEGQTTRQVCPPSPLEGGRPALPTRSHWGNRPTGVGISREVLDRVLDEPDSQNDGNVTPKSSPIKLPNRCEMEKIYDLVPRTEDMFKLRRADLDLLDELGTGNFGSVMRGVYRLNGLHIPVAVKTLKKDDMPTAECELMKEARVMAALDHAHIVRMIGVCKSDSIMLVLEMAPLGPLNKYLKKHSLSMSNILELMYQVAQGMTYLESKNFVHRDLAARNVLLVDSHYAKISDFGMSKALGIGNEYYKAETAGKWPLKWYAPECIYYFKFDSKSDVWSYGVTLWEATSYGAKPYRGMRGFQIIELIDHGDRLEKPPKCPSPVYDLMRCCWARESENRPTFQEITEQFKRLL